MKRRGSAGWNGTEKRALIVALVVSLLAHHTTISFLSPPRPPTARRAPIELVTVEMEEAGPAAERAVEGAGVPLAAAEPPAEATAMHEMPQDPAPRRERERQQPPRVARAEPEPSREPPEREEPRPPEPEPEPAPPSPAAPVQLHFVHLPPRTDEPERVPDDARFFAQRTQDVEQETRARATTLEGQEQPEAGAVARDSAPAARDGEADGTPRTDDGEDDAEREQRRAASRAAERRDREARAERAASTEAAPELRPRARPGGDEGDRAAAAAPPPSDVQAVRELPLDEPASEFPATAAAGRPGDPGSGAAAAGDAEGAPGSPRPATAARAGAGSTGPAGRGGSIDATMRPGDSPTLDWQLFEELFGEQADRERSAFLDRRRQRRRLGGAIDRADRAFAQLENFTPDVRPGNQTALDTLYHPFAEYLTAFHRKLHRHWGDGFLVTLTRFPDTHALNDMTLWVKLEIVVNGDGTIHKVTIVRHSGNLVFDVAAIDAVHQGEPYPSPTAALLSGDGRLYMRWAFHRNHSQCGVWNAEPYILPDPSPRPRDGEPPARERPPVGHRT